MKTEWTLGTLATLSAALTLACDLPTSGTKAATQALIADNGAVAELEQDLEGSLESPLSGTSPSPTGELPEAAAAAEQALASASLAFRPAGCLESELRGTVATHRFEDCTGPRGSSLTGTVTSTFDLGSGSLTVMHDARDFEINGAVVDHSTTVEYRIDEGRVLRQRTSATLGVTAGGRAIDHSGSFTIVYNPESGCSTREGAAQLTLDDQHWERTVEDLRTCGDLFTCPSSGSITMTGARAEGRIDVIASGVYDLTIEDRTDAGREMLWCSPE